MAAQLSQCSPRAVTDHQQQHGAEKHMIHCHAEAAAKFAICLAGEHISGVSCQAQCVAHRRVAQHADVEVGVAQPGGSLLQVLHGAQHHLRIEIVSHRAHVLALDGQLLVEQAEVVLQLRAACTATGAGLQHIEA